MHNAFDISFILTLFTVEKKTERFTPSTAHIKLRFIHLFYQFFQKYILFDEPNVELLQKISTVTIVILWHYFKSNPII